MLLIDSWECCAAMGLVSKKMIGGIHCSSGSTATELIGYGCPKALLNAVFYYNSKNFCVRGVQEHFNLRFDQLHRYTNPDRYIYREYGSKTIVVASMILMKEILFRLSRQVHKPVMLLFWTFTSARFLQLGLQKMQGFTCHLSCLYLRVHDNGSLRSQSLVALCKRWSRKCAKMQGTSHTTVFVLQ